jgi:FkbM family methyltransferase
MERIHAELKVLQAALEKPGSGFNVTLSSKDKVAVIIEPRKTDLLKAVVYNVMYNLGPDWNLHVFAHDIKFVHESLSGLSYRLTTLKCDDFSPNEYNNLLKSINFWNTIEEEHVLIFQTDSFILNPRSAISKFLVYPLIGGIYQFSCPPTLLSSFESTHQWGEYFEYTDEHQNNIILHNSPYSHFSINGGFSLRKRSAMIQCITSITKEQIIDYRRRFSMNTLYYENCDEIGEDTFFQHALEMLGYSLPKLNDCIDFCENLCWRGINPDAFGIHNVKPLFENKLTSPPIVSASTNMHDRHRLTHKLHTIHHNLRIQHGSFDEEFPEQLMAMRFLTGNEKVLEIGANVGRNSMIISSILNQQNNSDMVSLESDETTAKMLTQNRDLNSLQFHIEPSALSKRNLIQRGWDTMVSDVVLDGWKPVKKIDWSTLLDKYSIPFDTLVLDCEGAFYYILQDFPDILQNIQLIIMENDYHDFEHKKYVDYMLTTNDFELIYNQEGGWGCCYSCFFQTWKRKQTPKQDFGLQL